MPALSAKNMSTHPRIVVVGSANVDLTTFTSAFPSPGETIFGDKFDLGYGGKGANQAVAARLCGADVFMVAHVGEDIFGSAILTNLEGFGVNTTYVRRINGSFTGVAPIFVDRSGQNRIIVVKGANDTLKPSDVEAIGEVLKSADFIILQFEIPLETVYYTVDFARRNKIRCILNPAPGQTIDPTATSGLDYLVPNENEAEIISGMKVRDVADAKDCARQLLSTGVRHVIITLGPNGSVFATGDHVQHFPAIPMKSIDTTGAGDAFIGSFAAFVAEGLAQEAALKQANLYAGLSTTGVGAQKSFWNRSRFDAEWARVNAADRQVANH